MTTEMQQLLDDAWRKLEAETELPEDNDAIAKLTMKALYKQQQLLYPTKEGIHTERSATSWLRDVKHVGVEHWQEFFDACGTDEVIKTMKLYQLKAEYR